MDETNGAFEGLSDLLERHDISQGRAAREAGLTPGGLSRILSGHRKPRLNTINILLSWARRYEPAMTYDDLVGDVTPQEAPEATELAGAAAGGRHA